MAIVRSFGSVLGGFFVAAVLMGIGTLALDGWQPLEGQPAWYPWVLAFLVPPFALVGGRIVVRRMRGGRRRYSRRAAKTDRGEVG
jgi:hypothetical protein